MPEDSEEITRYTKLTEIQLPGDWGDDDYREAVKEIDAAGEEVDDFDTKFLESMLAQDGGPYSERQKQRIYKIHQIMGL